ncbi:MAG: VOC family protein [Bacteroidota bacterium]
MASVATTASVLRYRDLDAAVTWLCDAFGLERQKAIADAAGALEYAELSWGPALFLLSRVADSELERFMIQPDQVGGAATQACYLLVEDADAHCARARKAGAEIALDVRDDAFGGRSYACRDPEGHLWNFGTQVPRSPVALEPIPVTESKASRSRGTKVAVGLLSLAAIGAFSLAGWTYYRATEASSLLMRLQGSAAHATSELLAAQSRLAVERKLRTAAEQAQRQTIAQLATAREDQAAAERAVKDLINEREQLRAAKAAAERAAKEAQLSSQAEARARAAAEQSVEAMRAELARQVAGKLNADVRRADEAAEEKLRQAIEALRADVARETAARQVLETQIAALQTQRDEALQARDALAASAAKDRDALAEEREAKRQALELLAQEKLAKQTAQNALKEVEARTAEHRAASTESGAVAESGPRVEVMAKGVVQPHRKGDSGVNLLALYGQLKASPGSSQAERARSRLRTAIATTHDLAQLSRFIDGVGEGPFVDFARRRAQLLRGRQGARAQDEAKPPVAMAEQRRLLKEQKARTGTTP